MNIIECGDTTCFYISITTDILQKVFEAAQATLAAEKQAFGEPILGIFCDVLKCHEIRVEYLL